MHTSLEIKWKCSVALRSMNKNHVSNQHYFVANYIQLDQGSATDMSIKYYVEQNY